MALVGLGSMVLSGMVWALSGPASGAGQGLPERDAGRIRGQVRFHGSPGKDRPKTTAEPERQARPGRSDKDAPVPGSTNAARTATSSQKGVVALLAPPTPKGKVVAVSLRGDPASWPQQLKGALDGLGRDDLLMVRMRSLGGALRPVLEASSLLENAPCRTLAFLDGPVLGTSMLVAVSVEALVMAPSARIGASDATQFQAGSLTGREKKQLLDALEAVARRRKRPFDLLAAAVDRTRSLDLDAKPLSVGARGQVQGADKGEFLSLGAKAARELGLAEALASTLDEIRRLVGVADRDMLFDGKIYGPLDRRGLSGGRIPRAKPVDPVSLVAGASKVYLVPIHGTIDLGLAPFVKRVLDSVGPKDVVVLDLDTFGGRVDAAVKIRDALLSTKAKTIAFVDRRAISAGALISLACDLIVMTPGASMGAATPVQISGGKMKPTDEKVVSYMRKEMKSTAEAKGRRGDIAEAMVDRSVEVEDLPVRIKDKISGLRKGKLLTMTTDEALTLGMADFEAVDFHDLLKQLRLEGLSVVRPKVNWAEKVARFFTDPIVSGLLLTIGMLGLLIELYTPGFGVAGILGLLCLVLFFFGHMIADLAGWGHVILFAVGLVLLGLEIFVIPGFGIAGISGILLILISLVLALSGLHSLPFRVAWNLGYLTRALALVFGSIAVTALLGYAAIRAMPKSKLLSPMFLKPQPVGTAEETDLAPEALHARASTDLPSPGAKGRAVTLLRPAGKVRFGRRTYSAMAEGDYVEKGKDVEVVRHEAGRLVVRSLAMGGHGDKDASAGPDGQGAEASDRREEKA